MNGGSDQAVYPGQPISFSVFFTVYDAELTVGNSATVSIYIPDPAHGTRELLAMVPVAGASIPIRTDPQTGWRSIDPMVIDIAPPSPGTAIGELLYRVGDKPLTIEVTTDGAAAGPYVGTGWVTVIPEPFNSTWWLWNLAAPTSADWKSPYTLSGAAQNEIGHATLQFVLTLNETGPDGNRVVGAIAVSVVPGSNVPVSFPSITQDWTWFVPGISVIADVHRTYEYDVDLTASDGYGNAYAALSVPHDVFVQVSKQKTDYADASMTTGWLGILSGALSFLLWPLGIVSAGSGIAANVTGALALDPPTPNRRYRRQVSIPGTRIPWTTRRDELLPSMHDFLACMVRLARVMTALSEVESRLLGAIRDRVPSAAERQRTTARELIALARQLSNELPSLSDAAASSLAGFMHTPNGRASMARFKDSKLPLARVLKQLRRSGFAGDALKAARTLWSDRRWRRALATDGSMARLCRLSATSMTLAVRADLMAALAVLGLEG